MMFQLAILCGLLSLTVGQLEGSGCCAPLQWEAIVNEAASVKAKFGYGRFYNNIATLSYDFKGQKIRQDVTYVTNNKRPTATFIFDFWAKKAYRFNSESQSCVVNNLRGKLLRYCIPANAELYTNVYYGTGRDRFDISVYGYRVNERRTFISSSVSRDQCIPVEDSVVRPSRNGRYMGFINYANVTLGIRDPTVFDPPRFCQRENVDFEDLDIEPLDRFLVDHINSRIMQ